jgi:hypothetical protein
VAKGSGAQTGDLGPLRLEREGGFITLKPARKQQGQRGFSLLVKEEGSYTLTGRVFGCGKDLHIRAELSPGGDRATKAVAASAPHAAFCAQLPLVFRNLKPGDCIYRGGRNRRFSDILKGGVCPKYADIITACDADGPAAFIAIGDDLLVAGRDTGASKTGELFLIEVSVQN